MSEEPIWRTNEPCPACQAPLTLADTGTTVTWTCPACGWTETWQAGGDTQ